MGEMCRATAVAFAFSFDLQYRVAKSISVASALYDSSKNCSKRVGSEREVFLHGGSATNVDGLITAASGHSQQDLDFLEKA
ncbi:hypothetical protein NDU88_006029 [Pleurodeles waltl]|uniref:Uncharacterized protein n=1 Tax=Pleurodeles waltl TaxID=8319 RepID=A0AAV7MY08_PLEWA|nr:hypothetical protein NDU88_006029 [Pleurodeles waltl]